MTCGKRQQNSLTNQQKREGSITLSIILDQSWNYQLGWHIYFPGNQRMLQYIEHFSWIHFHMLCDVKHRPPCEKIVQVLEIARLMRRMVATQIFWGQSFSPVNFRCYLDNDSMQTDKQDNNIKPTIQRREHFDKVFKYKRHYVMNATWSTANKIEASIL